MIRDSTKPVLELVLCGRANFRCVTILTVAQLFQVHPVGRTCDVGLDIPGVVLPDDFKKLSATLQRPRSQKEEPVSLELNPDNTLGKLRILFHFGEVVNAINYTGREDDLTMIH
jgi:hypothetical protein